MSLDKFLFDHCVSKGSMVNSVKGKDGNNIAWIDNINREIFCMLLPGEYKASISESKVYFSIEDKNYEAITRTIVFNMNSTDDVVSILKNGSIYSKELGYIWYVKEI